MHFRLCGVVCVKALMEESQRAKEEDKEGAAWWAR